MSVLTANGAPALDHSLDNHLEFFSKGGSIRSNTTYYHDHREHSHEELFRYAWYSGNNELSMQLLFWCRDCRGGAGSRKTFRECIKWLAEVSPEWVNANISLIPSVGRWDDLKALYDTKCEQAALKLWADALISNDPNVTPLAAKWADRQDYKLRKFMYLSPKEFRKMLVRKTQWIVEHDMCSGKWEDIEYSNVPSVACARYRNAFTKHDQKRYEEWCTSLANTGDINAKALFPHDVVRLVENTSICDQNDAFHTLVDTMFNNLPNYIEDPNVKIMPICDFSASMTVPAAGAVTCMDVALGLGMYCSDKLGKDNPFYRKLIPFSSTSKLESWKDFPVAEAMRRIPNGYVGRTNIEGALNNILEAAIMWNVDPKDMITHLLILSDMQWDEGIACGDHEVFPGSKDEENVINSCMKKWVGAGYKKPNIVYWNLHSYNNQPATKNEKGVAMVSGFSPSVLKAVLKGEDFDPIKIMLDTVSKYNIIKP